MFLRRRKAPSLKYYPPYSELMKENPNLKMQSVSQGEYLNRVDNQSHGICGGLSTIHIISQLSAKKGEIINPFESEALLDKGYKIQYKKGHGANRAFMQKLFDEMQDMKIPVKNANKKAKIVNCDKFQYEETEKSLKRKIEKTSQDKNSRGTYIGARIRRNPKTGKPVSQNARHALSITMQYHEDYLYCTGMDSNFFFAQAKGKMACDELAEKISSALKSYNSTDIRHISVTMNNTLKAN